MSNQQSTRRYRFYSSILSDVELTPPPADSVVSVASHWVSRHPLADDYIVEDVSRHGRYVDQHLDEPCLSSEDWRTATTRQRLQRALATNAMRVFVYLTSPTALYMPFPARSEFALASYSELHIDRPPPHFSRYTAGPRRGHYQSLNKVGPR